MEGLIKLVVSFSFLTLFVFAVLLMLIGFVKFTGFLVQENKKNTSMLSSTFRTVHFAVFNKVTNYSLLKILGISSVITVLISIITVVVMIVNKTNG